MPAAYDYPNGNIPGFQGSGKMKSLSNCQLKICLAESLDYSSASIQVHNRCRSNSFIGRSLAGSCQGFCEKNSIGITLELVLALAIKWARWFKDAKLWNCAVRVMESLRIIWVPNWFVSEAKTASIFLFQG